MESGIGDTCLYMTLVFVAITVNFNQSTFTVKEYEGPVTPVLTLSKPSSCCLTIRATLKNVTATGKSCCTCMHTISNLYFFNYVTN